MSDHTAENFLNLREDVMCTQEELADALGVGPDDVARWETSSESEGQEAPEEAWAWLESAKKRQARCVQIINHYIDCYARTDEPIRGCAATIYPNQEVYERLSFIDDDDPFDLFDACYATHNAIARKIVEYLQDKGIGAECIYLPAETS